MSAEMRGRLGEVDAEGVPAGSPKGGDGATEQPVTLVVLQPDGEDIACAVRIAEGLQPDDTDSEKGSRAPGSVSRESSAS